MVVSLAEDPKQELFNDIVSESTLIFVSACG